MTSTTPLHRRRHVDLMRLSAAMCPGPRPRPHTSHPRRDHARPQQHR
ncbi:putative leader peptide [Janibacter sp. UYMM211]